MVMKLKPIETDTMAQRWIDYKRRHMMSTATTESRIKNCDDLQSHQYIAGGQMLYIFEDGSTITFKTCTNERRRRIANIGNINGTE